MTIETVSESMVPGSACHEAGVAAQPLPMAMHLKKAVALVLLGIALASTAVADTGLYFISPSDGDTVSSEFTVRFGLRGMGIAPAGIDSPNTGHHHLLIDMDTLPPLGLPLPNNDQVRHFGGGQTEATITLPPGRHTLQLLLGNYLHIPHDPPVISEAITITVE